MNEKCNSEVLLHKEVKEPKKKFTVLENFTSMKSQSLHILKSKEIKFVTNNIEISQLEIQVIHFKMLTQKNKKKRKEKCQVNKSKRHIQGCFGRENQQKTAV